MAGASECSIYSDPYLRLAFWTGLGAVALTLGIALFILGLRLQRHWQGRREQRFQQCWRPVLMQAVAGEPSPTLPPLARRDQWRFLKLWNHIQESVRGEATQRLSAVAYRLGCQHMARRLLIYGRLPQRLFALLTLGHMRDGTAWGLLTWQLRRPEHTSALYAARALIQIDPQRGVQTVVPHLLQRDDWEMVRIAILLQEFREALGGELARTLAGVPAARLPRALQLAEALQLHLPPEIVQPWLQPVQRAELLTAALRLANGAALLPAVRALADHPDWRVRVQSARALGRLGEAADVAVLTRLLADPQWWVRYRAAGALTQLPFVSRDQLRGLVAGLHDRYAREAYAQVLAERREASA